MANNHGEKGGGRREEKYRPPWMGGANSVRSDWHQSYRPCISQIGVRGRMERKISIPFLSLSILEALSSPPSVFFERAIKRFSAYSILSFQHNRTSSPSSSSKALIGDIPPLFSPRSASSLARTPPLLPRSPMRALVSHVTLGRLSCLVLSCLFSSCLFEARAPGLPGWLFVRTS